MGCFISYSRPDAAAVRGMRQDLQNAGHPVWLDQELGGGVEWWQTILEQIRATDVFVFAVSQHWLRSKPCQQEYAYAKRLGVPLLPVQVGPVENIRTLSIGQLQLIDYQNGSKEAFIALLNAVQRLTQAGWTRPAHLPPEPPVPYEYLMRLGDRLAVESLSSDQQLELLDQIRRDLEVEADVQAREDLRKLLLTLRQRSDVSYRTATEVDAVLARSQVQTAAAYQPPRQEQQRAPSGYYQFPQPNVAPPPSRPTPPPMGHSAPSPISHYAPAKTTATTPVLSVLAFVLGAIGLLFIPILFGGAAIACAAIGMARKERPAKVALIFAITATIVGMILGAMVGAIVAS